MKRNKVQVPLTGKFFWLEKSSFGVIFAREKEEDLEDWFNITKVVNHENYLELESKNKALRDKLDKAAACLKRARAKSHVMTLDWNLERDLLFEELKEPNENDK